MKEFPQSIQPKHKIKNFDHLGTHPVINQKVGGSLDHNVSLLFISNYFEHLLFAIPLGTS